MRIFISYRRVDWPFVHPLVEELTQYIPGSIFIDYQDIDDDDFEHSIRLHLYQSEVVLVVITPHTFALDRIWQDNDWIRRELTIALQLQKRIVPITLEDQSLPDLTELVTKLPPDIRPVITTKQRIPFYQNYFKEGVQKLASFIGVITGTGGVPLLKRGQDALHRGDYATAKREIERALADIQVYDNQHAVAQAKFLLSLVCLNGQRPFVQTLSTMREVDNLLNAALTLHRSRSYLIVFALFKLDFARNGLPHLEQEADQLFQQADKIVATSEDGENFNLLSQCQPDLVADYLNL
jgi:hypothetical protein